MAKKRVNKKERAQKRALLEQRAEAAEAEKARLEEQLAERDNRIEKLEERVEAQERQLKRMAALEAEEQRLRSALADRYRELTLLTRMLEERGRAAESGSPKASSAAPITPRKKRNRGRPSRAEKRSLKELKASGWFDGRWYLAQNPDVARSKRYAREPALHYLRAGAFEGRQPCPDFDSAWYLAANQDVAEAGVNPLLHFLRQGRDEGRAPAPEEPAE